MGNDYPDYPTKIFLDSNVILECLPLKDLPWAEIDSVGPILVMLTPTLVREVDSKKRDGRLGERAREFNRFVAPIAASGQPISLLAGTLRVDIGLAKCHRIDWDDYDDLDRTEGDACIVAEVLNVRGVPVGQKLVVGQDINPLFMAQRYGLRTHHVPASWLRQLEQSPYEKEVVRLRRQLADIVKTEPEFVVKFETPPAPVEIRRVQRLSEQEVAMLMKAILDANPKPEQKKDPLFYTQYDHSLDQRYSTYERITVARFANEYHKELDILFGQIPFAVVIENTGNIRADHINIDLQIVGGWFNAKPILTAVFPSAPRVKDPLMLHHLNRNFHASVRPVVGRHEVEIDEPRRSDRFSAQCQDFRCGQKWEFNGVAWLDPYYERDIVVIVKITSANLHGEVSETFKIQKSVVNSHASDLADLSNGRFVKTSHVNSLIEEAFKSSRYEAIEFDRFSNDD